MSAALETEGLGLAQHKSSGWATEEKDPSEVLLTSDGAVPRQSMMQVLGSKVAVEQTTSNATSFVSRVLGRLSILIDVSCAKRDSMSKTLWLLALVVTSSILWGLENFALHHKETSRGRMWHNLR